MCEESQNSVWTSTNNAVIQTHSLENEEKTERASKEHHYCLSIIMLTECHQRAPENVHCEAVYGFSNQKYFYIYCIFIACFLVNYLGGSVSKL